MTRGRERNTAHLVAETVDDARQQWVEVFGRDRADLGPAHARRQAIDAIDRYGPQRDAGSAPEPRPALTGSRRAASASDDLAAPTCASARGGHAMPISPAIRALNPPGSRGGPSCDAVAASITGCQAVADHVGEVHAAATPGSAGPRRPSPGASCSVP